MADRSDKNVIIIRCPYCERKLAAPMALAGKYAKCPRCPNRVKVPEVSTSDSRVSDSRENQRRFCPDCGNRLLPKEGNCTECAKSRMTSRPMKCPACERSLSMGTVVCTRCHHDRATSAPSIRGSVRSKSDEAGGEANWTVTCRSCRAVSYFELRRDPPTMCPQCAGRDIEAMPQTTIREALKSSDTPPDQTPTETVAQLRCYDCNEFVQPVANADQRGAVCPVCKSTLTQVVADESAERLLASQSLADKAGRMLEAGQYADALEFFQKADKLHQGHPQVMRGAGQSQCGLALERSDKAGFTKGLSVLEELLLLYPKFSEALADLQQARTRFEETFAEEYRVTDHTYSLHCQSINEATTESLRGTLTAIVEQMLRQLGQQTGALSQDEVEVALRELRDIQQCLRQKVYRLDIASHLPLRWLDDRLKQLTQQGITVFPVLDGTEIKFANQAWVRSLPAGEQTLQELAPHSADPMSAYPFVLAARIRKLSLSNADLIAATQRKPTEALFDQPLDANAVSLEITKQHQQQFSCHLSFRCHSGPGATRIAIAKPPGLGTEDVFLAVQVQRLALVMLWVLYGSRSMETMRKSQLDYLALNRQLQGRWISSSSQASVDFRELDQKFSRLGARRREAPKGWYVWQFAGLRGLRRLGRRLVIGIERVTGASLDTSIIAALHGLTDARQWPAQQPWPHLILGQLDGAGLGNLCEFLSSKVASPPTWTEGGKNNGSPILNLPDGPPPVAILGASAITHSFDQNLSRSLGLQHLETVDDVIVATGRVLPLIDPEWTRIWLAMKHVLANS